MRGEGGVPPAEELTAYQKELNMAERTIPGSGEDKPLRGLLSQAPERAVLVGVDMPGNGWPVEESLDELAQLATTAGVTCVDRVIQRLARPHPGTLLGSGKIQEIADLVRYHDCDAVIFDLELSPGQHRTLESALETQALDRTALILITPPATRTYSRFEGGSRSRLIPHSGDESDAFFTGEGVS